MRVEEYLILDLRLDYEENLILGLVRLDCEGGGECIILFWIHLRLDCEG